MFEPMFGSRRVLVTGAAGRIGRVLKETALETVAFDRPEHDVRDPDDLAAAAAGCACILHLAWDDTETFRSGQLAPDNLLMTMNVLEVAAAQGLRAVLASSVHADSFSASEATLIDYRREPVPDSPYGASKLWIEAMGRHAAIHRGVQVVAIRFGGVNPDDREPEDPVERAVWLPHEDCRAVLEVAVSAPLADPGYALVIGVGDGPDRVHALNEAFPWRPRARDRPARANTDSDESTRAVGRGW